MSTEELFRSEPYTRVCTASVVSSDNDGIVLNRTIFYPEGGGQPGDTGLLEPATPGLRDIRIPLFGNGWRNQGLLDFENNQRPSYVAYEHLIQQLQRSRYLSSVDYGSDVEAYAFHQAPNKVHVVWAKDDTSVNILVPKSKFVEAYDRDGVQITNPPLDGNNYKFTVGFSPIYIIRKP